MSLTIEIFKQILPQVTPSALQAYLQPLNNTMGKYGIDANKVRAAAFIANLAIESEYFTKTRESTYYTADRLEEVFPLYFTPYKDQNGKLVRPALAYEKNPHAIANKVYANRMGNGGESTGDGWNYRGGGPIQITGKENYIALSHDTKIDFINHPEFLAQPEYGCLSAGWFWDRNKINLIADTGNFVHVVEKINGGLNGYKDRYLIYQKALSILK